MTDSQKSNSERQLFEIRFEVGPAGERWEWWVWAKSPEEALAKVLRHKSVVRALMSEEACRFVVFDEHFVKAAA